MKRTILLILTAALSLLVLGSCLIPSQNVPEPDNLIYNSASELYIVVADAEFPSASVDRIFDLIASRKDKTPVLTDAYKEGAHNIVIGSCDADVSRAAYARLSSLDPGDGDGAYAIYSDGRSLALAYHADSYGYAIGDLMEYFIDNLVGDEIIVPAGTVVSDSFNVLERVEADDEAMLEKKWELLEQATNADTVKAMRALYSIYGDGVIDWIAGLYDPGVGGFYFSNSGKNTYGFLPDAESTAQALGFLNSSGIFDYNNGNWANSLPEEMLKQLGDFAYGLQDSDGYFYHPQWGKDIINSRRSRDLSHCVSILKSLGRSPKYKTMTGVGGDIDPASFLTESMGGSAVQAVSRVISVSDSLIPDHLQTTADYRAYINKLFDENHSYYAGHNLSSQTSEIKARGQEYVDITLEVLNARQKDNGLWQDEINYLGVNGLMKISGVYNSLGGQIPNAEKAVSAALFAITTNEDTTTVVQIWNAWAAADRIVKNIISNGNAAAGEAVRAAVKADAATYIEATKNKLLLFKRDDGSFSYNATGQTSGYSQSAAVSVKGTVEGDVNATTIAITSMLGSIHSLLGITDFEVPVYTESDRIRLMEILSELTPIIKERPVLTEPDPESFDELGVGAAADESACVTDDTNLGSATVVADPRTGAGGNVLAIDKPTVPADVGGDAIYINNMAPTNGATCNVFETEMCVASVNTDSANIIELRMQATSSSKIAYCLYFYMSGNNIVIKERGVSGTSYDRDICDSLTVGEWFKLRVEYYPGDHDSVRIKVKINDKLIAVSDNYYDSNGDKLYGEGKPQTALTTTRIFFNKTPEMLVYFDDVRCYQSDALYTAEALDDVFGYNVDQPAEQERIYDFDDGLSEELTLSGTAAPDSDGTLAMSAGAVLTAPANPVSTSANCVSFSLKVAAPAGASGDLLSLGAFDKNRTPGGLVEYKLRAKDGELLLVPVVSGSELTAIALEEASLGEEFTLAVDLYLNEGTALIYVDGKLSAASADVYPDGGCRFFGQLKVTAHSSVSIDELSAARSEKSFSVATSTTASQKKYDFESGTDDAVTDGTVVDTDGGKALSLGAEQSLTVPVNERAVAKNTTRFAFDLDLTASADGTGVTAYILDSDEAAIFALRFVKKSGKIYIYELCEQGAFTGAVSFVDSLAASFTMNYYPAEGVTVLTCGSTALFESGVYYSDGTLSSAGAYCTVTADDSALVDNVIAENLMATKVVCDSATAPSEQGGTIGFETSSNSSMPSAVTVTLNSAGAEAGIRALLRDGVMNKVLVMTTNAGGIDSVKFENTRPAASGSAYRFSADVKIDTANTASVWQLKLQGSSKTAFLVFFNVSGGKISLNESTYENATETVNGTDYSRITATHSDVADVGEWFNITVEYIPSDTGAEIIIYVDGEQVGESVLYYGAHVPGATAVTEVTGATLASMKQKSSEMFVDNVSLEKFNP